MIGFWPLSDNLQSYSGDVRNIDGSMENMYFIDRGCLKCSSSTSVEHYTSGFDPLDLNKRLQNTDIDDTEFSISLWFLPNTETTFGGLIGQTADNGNLEGKDYKGWSLNYDSGFLEFTLSKTIYSWDEHLTVFVETPTRNSWLHIVVNIKLGSDYLVEFFINNQKIEYRKGHGALKTHTNCEDIPLSIGSLITNDTFYVPDGYLSNIRIYDRCLSLNEISEIFSRESISIDEDKDEYKNVSAFAALSCLISGVSTFESQINLYINGGLVNSHGLNLFLGGWSGGQDLISELIFFLYGNTTSLPLSNINNSLNFSLLGESLLNKSAIINMALSGKYYSNNNNVNLYLNGGLSCQSLWNTEIEHYEDINENWENQSCNDMWVRILPLMLKGSNFTNENSALNMYLKTLDGKGLTIYLHGEPTLINGNIPLYIKSKETNVQSLMLSLPKTVGKPIKKLPLFVGGF